MLNLFFSRNSSDDLNVERTQAASYAGVLPTAARPEAAAKSKVPAPVSPAIAVLAAKGGSGATTISINLAAAFAQRHLKTTLVDASLQQPTVAHALGIIPPHSLMELVGRKSDLDEQLFRSCAVQVDGALSLNFLSPPLDGSAGVKSNLSEVTTSFSQIRDYSDLWLIDMPNHLDKHLVTMFDACTKIVLIFEATVAGVATCRRWLEVFQELGYESERIICVLNRSGSKFKAVEDQLDSVFTGRKLVRIPNASQLLWQSATEGIPAMLLQPNHAFCRSISKLAETVASAVTQE